jgi:hypothetical protein
MRNPIAPKCGPSHQFVMNPALIQKELGMRNNEDDSEETRQNQLRVVSFPHIPMVVSFRGIPMNVRTLKKFDFILP